jgi:hypothetical protein
MDRALAEVFSWGATALAVIAVTGALSVARRRERSSQGQDIARRC